jgi:YVTN family beta-propeller protein
LILLFLVFTWQGNLRSFGGKQYDPPPDPPDIPFPDDPPDLFDDPFDPINDLPDPFDIPFPPEDPIDFPDPILDFPPPDLDDPFDEPSLFPDPFEDIPDPFEDIPDVPLPPFPPDLALPMAPTAQPQPLSASNVVTSLMPFPMRLPFHPAYSGVSAPKTVRPCSAASAVTLLAAEANRNTVAFINTCPYAIAQRVTVGSFPLAVKVTPDRQFAWVSNGDSASISIVNIGSKTVVGTISLPAFNGDPATPGSIAFTPDGSVAYVTNHDANPGSVIFVIDVPNRKLLTTIPTDGYPASVAITPDGTTVWVPNRADSTITIIDTMTNTVTAKIAADYPLGVAFNPTGTRAYVAEAELGNAVGYLRVFDVSSTATIARIPVGGLPHTVRVTPSGHDVFVTNVASNSISQIDPNTNTVIRTIPVPGQHPLGLAFVR